MIVCLLPARNAAGDLPGYLESAGWFADAVVALDDGSTDASHELLQADPLVEILLTNPRRDGYGGWMDSENRSRLLEAASTLSPDWVVFLDADERIDREDADALLEFVAGDALPGCAYGLELHRMWGDDRCVAAFTWVYRLFAFSEEYTLPRRRLHFNPVPVEIPRSAWVRTTIRVRHLDSPERLAGRRAKYLEADPLRAMERRPARLLAEPRPDELVTWSRRERGTPVLDPERVAERDRELASGRTVEARGRPPGGKLTCLVPIRDGDRDLPGYLESVGSFCDAVVALDDGSTDRTSELLQQSPLVERAISNPPRQGFAGWDDAQNRARLLSAAAELRPDWLLWLDVDERIDPEDGRALRRFLGSTAVRGEAYGFRVFRMIGDEQHYDDAGLWAFRLFAWEPGQRLPLRRLHLVPVPTSIPRSRWRRTTVRIKHVASLDERRRAARLRKYEQADPERTYQADYAHLTRPAASLKTWMRRPRDLPVLAEASGAPSELDLHSLDLDAPFLSAIVISRDDEERIEASVRSIVEQDCPLPFEVIVVTSGSDRTAEIVGAGFPQVTMIELSEPALPGRARNAGLAAARGDVVSFPGSHIELPQGSLAARMRAHERGYPMVTGSIVNGTTTRSGWASYFLDHPGALPGRPSGVLGSAPAHCSYLRDFLLEVGGFPEDLRAGEDTVVNEELTRRGRRAYRSQELRLIHRSPCTNPVRLVRHHFVRGRGLGRILLDERRGRRVLGRRFLATWMWGYLPRRLAGVRRAVARWGDGLEREYRNSRPLIALGAAAAWAGLWYELLRPGRGKLSALIVDRPPEPVRAPRATRQPDRERESLPA
jgi:glycosyltransferase involved in cell wall biosynthesis